MCTVKKTRALFTPFHGEISFELCKETRNIKLPEAWVMFLFLLTFAAAFLNLSILYVLHSYLGHARIVSFLMLFVFPTFSRTRQQSTQYIRFSMPLWTQIRNEALRQKFGEVASRRLITKFMPYWEVCPL